MTMEMSSLHRMIRTVLTLTNYRFPLSIAICTFILIVYNYVRFSKSTHIDKHSSLRQTSWNKTIPTPSVYLITQGGLGNQLFQYACSYALSRKYNIPLFLLLPEHAGPMTHRRFAPHQRTFGLDYFQLGNETTLVDQSWNFTSPIKLLKDRNMFSGSFHSINNTLMPIEYCQSETFFAPFRDEVLAAFQFLKLESILTPTVLGWKNKIDSAPNSVALHIRRGDFKQIIRVPPEFYRDSIQQMAELLSPVEPTFFLFTDEKDLATLNTEFQFLFESNFTVHLVSNSSQTNSLQELYLMKSCKHQIIPNSSFGWWGAYLNTSPKKIVIAAHHNPRLFDSIHRRKPKEAAYYKFQYRYFYYPQNWFVMDPFNEPLFIR